MALPELCSGELKTIRLFVAKGKTPIRLCVSIVMMSPHTVAKVISRKSY